MVENSFDENNNIIWIDKYKPSKIEDIIGYDNEIKKILNWIENFNEYRDLEKPILMLEARCGYGKSIIAELALKKFNYNIIHVSDDDSSELDISQKLENAVQYRNIFDMFKGVNYNKTAVIIDDIDKINTKHCSRINSRFFQLLDVKKSNIKITVPVICTLNKRTKTLTKMKRHNTYIKFKKRDEKDIIKIIKNIVKLEKISMSVKIYKKISNTCRGDIRMLLYMIYNVVCNNDLKVKEEEEKKKNKRIDKNKTTKNQESKEMKKESKEMKKESKELINIKQLKIKKIKKIKEIDDTIHNYRERIFDNEAFESIKYMFNTDISVEENKNDVLSCINSDPFLMPYLVYQNYSNIIFDKNKNNIVKNNKHIIDGLVKCSNIFNECNKYWDRVYTSHEHEFSDYLSYISSIGVLYNMSKIPSTIKKNKDNNIEYSTLLNKTSLLQKRNKKLRLSSVNNNLNIIPEDIKSIAEYLYNCLDVGDYKKMAEIVIEYNIPYREVSSKNKVKYILDKSLSDLFSLLNFKKNKKINKKIEEEILKYLVIKV